MNEKEHKVKAKRIKRSFVIVTILFFLTLVGFAVILNDVRNLTKNTSSLTRKTSDLTHANQRRINDIQTSRVESCKHTYKGVSEVFRPFFPKKEKRTKREQWLIDKLNQTIVVLQRGCEKQTRPKDGR